jgi:hypothetical protein
MRRSPHQLISGRGEPRTKILCSRARRGEEMFYTLPGSREVAH